MKDIKNEISKLSNSSKLKKTIKKETHSDVNFWELETRNQESALRFINDKELGIKVFKERGYDILNRNFFAIEYSLKENNETKIRRIFESFGLFYDYVEHEIYNENTCFYGYQFSEEEIKKYNLFIKQLNFDSFISYDIIEKSIEIDFNYKKNDFDIKKSNNKKLSKLLEKVRDNPRFYNFKNVEKELGGQDVFCSLITRDVDKEVLSYYINYANFSCYDHSTYMKYIWLHFGEEIVTNYISNYRNISVPEHINTRWKSELKIVLSRLKNSTKIKYFSKYQEETGYFVVNISYFMGEQKVDEINEYFFTFEEMAEYLNNDLTSCDLKDAFIKIKDLTKYKVDESTTLPFGEPHEKTIKKYYKDNKFFVEQTLFNKEKTSSYKKINEFEFICDFIHFLRNDLSNSDLIMCNGISNLKGIKKLNLDGILVSRDDLTKLEIIPTSFLDEVEDPQYIELINKNELCVNDNEIEMAQVIDTDEMLIGYISDLHLEHRFLANRVINVNDGIFYIRDFNQRMHNEIDKIEESRLGEHKKILLFAGDITNNLILYELFFKEFDVTGLNAFVTLGNHELWPFEGETIKEISSGYRNLLKPYGIKLVQNNLFYITRLGTYEISSEELANISDDELIVKTREAELIIFGGIGFSGKNKEFNADNFVYRNAINREEEIKETSIFNSLFLKVKRCLKGKNVIILTHMPIKDWIDDAHDLAGFTYVNGHNHRNFFDRDKHIYADNQIGYKAKNIGLKFFTMNETYSWFSSYEDGTFEISKYDYFKFYRGINYPMEMTSDYEKIFMIKKNGLYLFLASKDDKLYVLEGGNKKRTDKSINYFSKNLDKYVNNIKSVLKDLNKYLKEVSNEVKKIGGIGTIHGLIIDISFYTHIFFNPFESKLTYYSASSIINKDIYENFISLLKDNHPSLYLNFMKMIKQNEYNHELALYDLLNISKNVVHDTSTDIYKYSNFIKSLQCVSDIHVIRRWSNEILKLNDKEFVKSLVESKLIETGNSE